MASDTRMRRFAITWTIPDAYGGMTSAMLHRSRAFAAGFGGPVDVLTFDPRPDYPAIRARLTEAGAIGDGVRLRNLYEDLRDAPAVAGPGAVPIEPGPRAGGTAVDLVQAADGASVRITRDGEVVRVAHSRADGTLAVLEERGRAGAPRRLITAFDADERPTRQWSGRWRCYADWVEGRSEGGPAVAIVDSKTMAPFAAQLRVPGLATVHVVHASHLEGRARPYGPLRRSRADALARLEDFDAVVFLTGRQRDDAIALLGDPGNLAVVPNAIELPAPVDGPRDPEAGVVVAGLTPRKRVDHAIRGVAAVEQGGTPARLVVVGDGPEGPALRRLSDELGVVVSFAGHRPDGAAAFAEASWMLLTSRSEGAPLVLVEAMARGCLPIAYDIAYGPADVIEPGVNGWLVPDGDLAALRAAVDAAIRTPPERLAAMRDAARRTAEAFGDDRLLPRWRSVEEAALARHAATSAPGPAPAALSVDHVRLRRRGGRLGLTMRVPTHTGARLTVTFRVPGTTRLVRRVIEVRPSGRVRIRLDQDASALLETGRRITVVLRSTDGVPRGETRLDPVHPDARSLPRRARDRLARAIGIRARPH